MNKPNLFIVGAPKCGTTSLYEYLAPHPQVFMSLIKEPHYFNTDLDYRHVTSESDYLALFRQSSSQHRIIGEASTNYVYSHAAIPNILRFNSNAKIILMLRRPFDLVKSLHRHLVYKQLETEPDLEKAWELPELATRAPKFAKQSRAIPGHLSYKNCAQLGQITQRVLATVPPDQLQIIFFDDFVSKPRETFRSTLSFLELDESFAPNFTPRNESQESRFPVLTRMMLYPPFPLNLIKRGMKGTLNLLNVQPRGSVYRVLGRKNQRPSNCSEPFESRVTEYYFDDTRLLGELTNRDLREWLISPVPTVKGTE